MRTHKRVGEQQQQTLSNILNAASNGEHVNPPYKRQCIENRRALETYSTIKSSKSITLPSCSSQALAFNFTGCTSITLLTTTPSLMHDVIHFYLKQVSYLLFQSYHVYTLYPPSKVIIIIIILLIVNNYYDDLG